MSRKTIVVVIFVLFCLSSIQHHYHLDAAEALTETNGTVLLQPSKATILNIPATSHTILLLRNISSSSAYLICQIHTQFQNLTLSLTPYHNQSQYVTGHGGMGVVTVLQPDQMEVTWHLFSNQSDSVRALVYVTPLTADDPLPGGCNVEYDLEYDPELHLRSSMPLTSTVLFQWASVGFSRSYLPPNCEYSVPQVTLEYKVYVRYNSGNDFSEDAYFDAVQSMITAGDLNDHGFYLQTVDFSLDSKSQITTASYDNQGAIYNVMVTQTKKTTGSKTAAAYIPRVFYTCDLLSTGNDKCGKTDVAAVILATFGGIIGVFLCFLGHRFFKIENFLFGFLAFGLIFYQVMAISTSESEIGNLSVAALFGIIGGCLYLLCWWYLGFPLLSVLMNGLVAGYLISSIIFYTPFGNLPYWDTQFNYGMTFTCGVLIVPVIILCFTRVLNILSCTFVGSYGVILAIDVYINGGLKFIIVNSLRHAVHQYYLKIVITGPFTTNEIILVVVWFTLFICGTVFQLVRERKRAPFPPSPRQSHQRDAFPRLRRYQSSGEREPLLNTSNSRQYGTVYLIHNTADDYEDNEEVNRISDTEKPGPV
ncbi:hypothetical protein ACJMK2_020444 [Sinanodonta woodiana]|uniref:TM7S3/TM198-like domain-containing protein n=1 Tax=Sinanodonta woodiana TaxID=1069815 RepID=A0ABD3U0H4_SINWO